MSYLQVINPIQSLLNNCGELVLLTPIGNQSPHEGGQMTIEFCRIKVLRQNNCCNISTPISTCANNPLNGYWVNRIRLS